MAIVFLYMGGSIKTYIIQIQRNVLMASKNTEAKIGESLNDKKNAELLALNTDKRSPSSSNRFWC